jgi:hypothetical protein
MPLRPFLGALPCPFVTYTQAAPRMYGPRVDRRSEQVTLPRRADTRVRETNLAAAAWHRVASSPLRSARRSRSPPVRRSAKRRTVPGLRRALARRARASMVREAGVRPARPPVPNAEMRTIPMRRLAARRPANRATPATAASATPARQARAAERADRQFAARSLLRGTLSRLLVRRRRRRVSTSSRCTNCTLPGVLYAMRPVSRSTCFGGFIRSNTSRPT